MMGIPTRIKSYQTLADLLFVFLKPESVANYRREPDLTTGIALTSYKTNGTTSTRDVFISEPDQVIVIQMTADRSRQVNFTARFDRRDAEISHARGNRLVMRGKLEGVAYEAQVLPRINGGSVKIEDGKLIVEGAYAELLSVKNATHSFGGKHISPSIEEINATAARFILTNLK